MLSGDPVSVAVTDRGRAERETVILSGNALPGNPTGPKPQDLPAKLPRSRAVFLLIFPQQYY